MSKIRKAREAKHLTQAQLAALTGGTLSQGDISKLETDYWNRPSPKLKREVAKALGVEEAELFPNLNKKGE